MLRFFTLFLSTVMTAASAFGFEVGDRVVVVHEVELDGDGPVGDKIYPGTTLKIEAIDGNRIWVCDLHPGWLESKHVVGLDAGLNFITEMIRTSPGNASLYLRRSSAWRAKMKYSKAISDCNAAIRLDPNCGKAFLERANVRFAKDDYDKAIADLNESIRCDSNDASAHFKRGVCWKLKNEIDKSINDLNDAVRLDPNHVKALVYRGMVFGEKGEDEKAISDFEEGIRRDPVNASAYVARGVFRMERGDHKNAISDFTEAVRIDPKRLEGHQCLALIYSACSDDQCRDGKKGLEHATRACEATQWKSDFALAILAAAYAENGEWEKAVTRQEQSLEVVYDIEMKHEGRVILKLYKDKQPLRLTSFKGFLP